MAELKTPHGLIVGLILDSEPESVEKVEEAVDEKPVATKSAVKPRGGEVPRRGRKKST